MSNIPKMGHLPTPAEPKLLIESAQSSIDFDDP